MQAFLFTIFDFIVWIFVPAILVAILWFTRSIAKRTDDERHQHATHAGFWAGFMLFLIFLVNDVGFFVRFGFPSRPLYQGFSVSLAMTGAIVGFLLFSGGKKVLPPKLAGWIVLVISFAGFYALFHYLFVRDANEMLLSLILGVTFGIFAHMAASPGSVREFLSS